MSPSLEAFDDASADGMNDASPSAPNDARPCGWCRAPLADPRARYCSTRCRQTAWRLRRRSVVDAGVSDAPGVFAYADPPYPGFARKYYGDQPTFGGEVDHRALVASLEASGYAGWALSTSARALRDVLAPCPPTARVCAWTKPHGVPSTTAGIHNAWEPLIVVGGRQRRPGVRDHLRALPARGGGDLMGRKPLAFCAWLFDLLGMAPGDQLVDIFPGTGVVTQAWEALSSTPRGDARRYLSLGADGDASLGPRGDASPRPGRDASADGMGDGPVVHAGVNDASPGAPGDGGRLP